MAFSLQNPLIPILSAWREKIRQGLDQKGKRFQKDADEGVKFFTGPYEFLYGDSGRQADRHFKQRFDDQDEGEIPAPRFQMTVNKVAELVQIFGPMLYHDNPVRQVNPRTVPLPDQDFLAAAGPDPGAQMFLTQLLQQAQAQRAVDAVRAKLLQAYLNYTPDALDLKTEARSAIDESLIKGMGLLWTEVYRPPTGGQMVGSFFDSVDNLVIDPDMPSLRTAKWVARKCLKPRWEVERKYNLPANSLRGAIESASRQAEVQSSPDGEYNRRTGRTNDLVAYWEVWSKTGLGGRLQGVVDWIAPELEVYGDYCYLVVADGVDYPLNVPNQVWDQDPQAARQAIYQMVQWPTPFWADDDWPFTPFYFHSIPSDPWPMSHLSPGMGELKFLNWAYSYIAGKIRVSCRDIVAVLSEASQQIKTAIVSGADYELIEIKASHGKTINEIVQFLQHPPFNADIWKVIEAVAEQFERRVGLTDLMYGESPRQMRSAQEAAVKNNATTARPDDMANKIEDAMSAVARKEALACRWHLLGQDVAAVLGPVGGAMWDKFLAPANPTEVLYSLEYRIEAGSARKPNRDRDAQNAKDVVSSLLPFFENLVIQAGIVAPYNAAVTAWMTSIDMNPAGFLLKEPAPPPPQPQPGPGGPGGPPPGAGGPHPTPPPHPPGG